MPEEPYIVIATPTEAIPTTSRPEELIVAAVPTFNVDTVDTPVTKRSLVVAAIETPRVAIVAIPEISKFLPLTSSYTRSPTTFKLPSTYTSLANVPIPLKVDTPVTKRSLDVVAAETQELLS